MISGSLLSSSSVIRNPRIFFLAILLAVTAIAAPAQTFNILVNFDGVTSGQSPYGLVQGTDGNFYGVTQGYGIFSCSNDSSVSCGTVYKLASDGTFTTLYNFPASGNTFPFGIFPDSALVQGSDGNFYGTTLDGGPSGTGSGTVFQITPDGTLTSVFAFAGNPGGFYPYGLIQDDHGIFYGTTYYGGRGQDGGTFYRLIPQAGSYVEQVLHNFCSQPACADGSQPNPGLIRGLDGNFYGTTAYGGFAGTGCSSQGCGTIFKLTPNGTLTTLYTFCEGASFCGAGLGSYFKRAMGNSMARPTPAATWRAEPAAVARSSKSAQTAPLIHSTNFVPEPIAAMAYSRGSACIQASDGNLYGINDRLSRIPSYFNSH